MDKRYNLPTLLISLLGLYLCTGCADEMSSWGADETSNGLVLELKANGRDVSSGEGVPSNHTLREDVVEDVNVFFFTQNQENLTFYYKKNMEADGKVLLENSEWKEKFLNNTYDIYVIANLHSYDNPATSEIETDLSWITTRAALKALKDKDVDIFKAEGDRFSASETYTGKKFLMDGKLDNWNSADQDKNAVIKVNLSRAAAKIQLNVSYTDGFLTTGREVTDVRKKMVRYAEDSYVCTEAGVIPIPDLKGEANNDNMSQPNSTEGSGISRKDVLYTYSYPNNWGDNVADKETYILLNIPYKENVDGSETVKTANYYKVPIRVSNTAADLCLKRNTVYTVNVTIDRLGNEEIDKSTDLTPTVTVAPWKETGIDVDSHTPFYLMVSEDSLEMHNVADTTVTFFSSTPIKVEVTEAYFINKKGQQQNIPNISQSIKNEYDSKALTGKISIHSDIPANITARYITLKVTNSDKPTPLVKEIHIVQYPLEYISGVPGVYSTRDDFTNNTYEYYKKGTKFTDKPTVELKFGEEDGWFGGYYVFYSKVYGEKTIYQVSTKASGSLWNKTYQLKRGGENASGQNNNRMYLVQVTSTSEDYVVARPATEDDNGQLVTVSSEENNQLVSPYFMLASQLGVITSYNGGGTWQGARNHCKYYVEVIDYGDTVRTLKDWRLPTEVELSIIAKYQTSQPDVMDKVLVGKRYWTALNNKYYTVPGGKTDATGVRCIRDVTPQDLAEFRAHGIK